MKMLRILFAVSLFATIVAGLPRIAAADDETKEAVKKTAKATDASAVLEAKERQMCDAFKNKDSAAFMALVDPKGWGVDPNGVMPVSQVPDMMKQCEIRSYMIDNFKTVMVNNDAYIATYRYKADATMAGQPYPPGPWYVTTVWAKRGKDWKAVFHQETLGMPASASSSSEGH